MRGTEDQRARKYVEVPTSATAPQASNHAVTIARLMLTRRACGPIPFPSPLRPRHNRLTKCALCGPECAHLGSNHPDQLGTLQPTWSPDGSRISFRTDFDGDFDVHTVGADGGTHQPLTNDSAQQYDPAWALR
jgi:hypothetical protein